VLCLEALSVMFWGPLSLLAAKYVLDRDPRRFIVQTVVCTGHLYGVAIYYSTSLVEMWMNGKEFSRPELLYFWIYFIGFNAPWAVVPAGK
jgi:cholestenol delta-isomerase